MGEDIPIYPVESTRISNRSLNILMLLLNGIKRLITNELTFCPGQWMVSMYGVYVHTTYNQDIVNVHRKLICTWRVRSAKKMKVGTNVGQASGLPCYGRNASCRLVQTNECG
jgi:hypothetical protein